MSDFLPRVARTVAHTFLTYGFVLLFVSIASAENRFALVIGNDRYVNLASDRQLLKAVNDAQAVGDTLAKIGFSVIRGSNLGRQGMIDKLAELTAQLQPGDTAVFFYAGHGVAIGGVNYLVPSDVPAVTPDAEARVRGASIAEADVVAELQAKGVRVALLVLDACRDNPFPRTAARSVGNTRGLVDAKPARGVFTIYSAGIGQTALDRLEPNDPSPDSVFTRVFVSELAKPGIDLAGLAIETRERVAQLALLAKDGLRQPAPHEQTPAYYDQTVGGRIYLAGVSAIVGPPVAPVRSGPCGLIDTLTVSLSHAAVPLSAAEECSLRPKDVFKECANCPEMVVVPAGSFIMGSPPNELDRSKDEGPQHRVAIARQFAIGKGAATYDEWDACVTDGGCDGYRRYHRGGPDGRLPVTDVTWEDAQAYLVWLSKKTGKTYRLLSEAEYEYATRAGTETVYPWGNAIGQHDGRPLGSFGPNGFDLFDMVGNVWAWTEDCYHDNYGQAPIGGTAWTTDDCSSRVLRGGYRRSALSPFRSAERFSLFSPNSGTAIGFRVARTLTTP